MSTEGVISSSLEERQSSTPSLEDTGKDKVVDSPNPSSESSDDAKNSKPDGSSTSPGPSNNEQSENQHVISTNPTQGDWQAIWSPQHNAYYFYNMQTNETTWTNPLAGSELSSSSSTAVDGQNGSSFYSYNYDLQAAAVSQGIDPSLAYLDPSLAAGPSAPTAFTYQAKFNARTGAFTKPDGRDPDHVSEYERMKRMSQFYFDVSQWEQEVAQRHEEEVENPKKRKKPTKKDLVSSHF